MGPTERAAVRSDHSRRTDLHAGGRRPPGVPPPRAAAERPRSHTKLRGLRRELLPNPLLRPSLAGRGPRHRGWRDTADPAPRTAGRSLRTRVRIAEGGFPVTTVLRRRYEETL